MHRLVLAALVVAATPALAHAGEALLIRHDVVTVEAGHTIRLEPGFFIGRAATSDDPAGAAALARDRRSIRFDAREPGRTVVTAWNQREPDARIEFEVVVVPAGVAQ